MLDIISSCAVPAVIIISALIMTFGKKDYFSSFCIGAKQGLNTAVSLLPTLVILNVSVSLLFASGLTSDVANILYPFAERIGVPEKILPLLMVRPISGSASTAVFAALLEACGPDSFPAVCASVILGSSDTLTYVTAVYFSSVGVKHTRHTYFCAITVMLFCIFFSCFLVRLLYF